MRDSEHFTLWPTSPQNDDMSLFAEQRKQLVGSGFKSSSSRQQVEHDKERGNNIGILGSSDIPRDVATPKLCSNSWESQSLPIAREGTESAKRARKLAEEARLIGIDTAVELGKQTERLETIQDDVESIHNNLEDAEYQIHEIEGGFFGDILPFRRPFHAYKRTGATVEVRTIEDSKKGVFGSDIEGLKTRKTDKNSIWAVVKNQEQRKQQEVVERKQKTSVLKSPWKYLWSWWSGSDSNTPERGPLRDRFVEEKGQDRDGVQHCDIEESESHTNTNENLLYDSLASSVEKHIRKQDEELDKIDLALKDIKEIAFRMNEELHYQEGVIDNLQVNVEDANYRVHDDWKRVKRI